jgi:hypothetical protein
LARGSQTAVDFEFSMPDRLNFASGSQSARERLARGCGLAIFLKILSSASREARVRLFGLKIDSISCRLVQNMRERLTRGLRTLPL